jgi:hypothetical protein
MSTLGIIKISEADRLETAKSVIVEHRAKAGARASYELFGIDYNDNRLRVTRIDHAPTSADFSPMIAKKRIAQLVDRHAMVVEFRGAWKSDTEGKVVAYESTQQADINAAK